MDGEALPSVPGAPALRLPSAGCAVCPAPCLQMVVQQGLAPRARELRANSSALEEAILGEQQRLGRGECRDPQPLAHAWGLCSVTMAAALCGNPLSTGWRVLPWGSPAQDQLTVLPAVLAGGLCAWHAVV